MNYTALEQKINENKPLDFGDILSKSIELFKKTWKQGVLHALLSVGLVMCVVLLVLIPMYMTGVFNPEVFDSLNSSQPDYRAIVMMYLILFPAVFIASIFVSLINMAFYNIIKQIDLEEEVSLASFGMFFKAKFFVKALVITILSFLISVVAMLACYFPLFYVMIPLSLLIPIFSFNPEMSSSDLIKASFKLGTKKWLITFGLLIVSGLLAELVGLLLCGIGLFVTMSFVYLPMYFVYKDAIGFDNESKSSEVN
jgi:hypothetical protein